jgi:hypothetical protein
MSNRSAMSRSRGAPGGGGGVQETGAGQGTVGVILMGLVMVNGVGVGVVGRHYKSGVRTDYDDDNKGC